MSDASMSQEDYEWLFERVEGEDDWMDDFWDQCDKDDAAKHESASNRAS